MIETNSKPEWSAPGGINFPPNSLPLGTDQKNKTATKEAVIHKSNLGNKASKLLCGVNYFNTSGASLTWNKVTCKKCLKGKK